MAPKQILDIIHYIKNGQKPNLVIESRKHAEPLAIALFESKCLYDLLHTDASLNDITEQISRKNKAARYYFEVTGNKWPF
tara:strand:- start:338 stop:577 length:240 start_codon:yes stop_codon:yes gene_type:complete